MAGGSCCGGGCNINNNKDNAAKLSEDVAPHPVLDQLPGVQFCVRTPPPWLLCFLLGFQHYILTLGTTVMIPSLLVPQMGGGKHHKAWVIQASLLISGINTLLQASFGSRLPAVVVGSHAYILPVTAIINARRYRAIADPTERFEQTMRGIQGALILAAAFQILVGFLGLWRNFGRALSPLSAVPLVAFTGMGLHYMGLPILGNCVAVGLPAIIIMLFFCLYLPQFMKTRTPVFDRFAVLIVTVIGWTYAIILTSSGVYSQDSANFPGTCRTDRADLIRSTNWIEVPLPFHWGQPTFTAGDTFAMMAASIISLIESTGAFIAIARYGSATPVPPSVISRGGGWLGIGVMLSGLFGCLTGSTISVENAGLVALTKVGSRRVAQISAMFMIVFSVLGKFGAIFASIPLPVAAAMYCICYSYVCAAGLGLLQFCNLNSFRSKFILGLTFFMSLSISQYFNDYDNHQRGPVHTHVIWFNNMVNVVFMSHASVAVLIAVFLDCTLGRKSPATRKDTGLPWWEKFYAYGADVRTDEFYALPCRLNNFFPAL
uniref:Uncharacterized protein n=1 Tax=Kalanchoe fedtschenkoi TaxID=63787 RepID=A0A7N0T603_KALFE